MPTYVVTGRRGTSLTFDASGTRQTGVYVNGDKWIEGPVDLTATSPAPAVAPTTSRAMNGAQKDPYPAPVGGAQGYDDQIGAFAGIGYDASRNIALTVSTSGPQTLTPTAGNPIHIVKVQSRLWTGTDDRECIAKADVYTILHSDDIPPSSTCFRPPYFGPTKLVENWDFANIDVEALLPAVDLNIDPGLVSSITTDIDGPWAPDHTNGWARQIHPRDQMPPYYEDTNAALSSAFVLCCSDQRTDTALIGLIQYGIDCYGARLQGLSFRGSLGHNSGRQQPMLFAAYMLGMQEWLEDLRDNHFTAEHEQTFYVRKTDRIAIATGPVGTFRHEEVLTGPGGWTARCFGVFSGHLYVSNQSGALSGPATVVGTESGASCAVTGTTTSTGYNNGVGFYTASELNMAEWAHPHYANMATPASIPSGSDNVNWTAPPAPFPWYRRGNSADSWLGMATGLRALGLNEYFGGLTGQSWFDYTERYAFLEPVGTFTPGYSGTPNTWTPTGDTLPSALEYDAYDLLWNYEAPGGPSGASPAAAQSLGQGFYPVAAAGLGGVLIQ